MLRPKMHLITIDLWQRVNTAGPKSYYVVERDIQTFSFRIHIHKPNEGFTKLPRHWDECWDPSFVALVPTNGCGLTIWHHFSQYPVKSGDCRSPISPPRRLRLKTWFRLESFGDFPVSEFREHRTCITKDQDKISLSWLALFWRIFKKKCFPDPKTGQS